MGNNGQTPMKKLQDEHWNVSVVNALKDMADLRQAKISADTLVRYAENLSEWELSELLPVINEISFQTRKRGETAFPPLADIVEGVRARALRSHDENKNRANYKKQELAFWAHVDYLKQQNDMTEQDVLDQIKIPGFTGLKARQRRDL